MTGPRTPARSSTNISQASTSSQSNAALLGAATAFGRPTLKSAASANVTDPRNGALAAASSAGLGSRTASPVPGSARPPLSRVGSSTSTVTNRRTGGAMANNGEDPPNLALPQQERPRPSKSPSQQAAALATARAPPLSTPPTGQIPRSRPNSIFRPAVAPKPKTLSRTLSTSAAAKPDRPNDLSPIAPTSSLVDLFERRLKTSDQQQHNKPEPLVIKPNDDLSIQSPKPVKPTEGITSMFHMELGDSTQATTPQPTRTLDDVDLSDQLRGRLSEDSIASTSEVMYSQSSPPARSRGASSTITASPATIVKSQTGSWKQPTPSLPIRRPSSQPIQHRASARSGSLQSDTLSVSGYSVRTLPAQYNKLHPRRPTPLMNDDELANAMVAGSLASSRRTSPRKIEPPPVPTRKKKHHHHTPHVRGHGISFSRTPSPVKTGMLHTLRSHEDSDSSSGEEKKKHHPYGKQKAKRLVRKHPNKHHEGDRKRWRDAVSARERKRYEGVWAANKGLYYSFTGEEQAFMTRNAGRLELRTAVSEQVSNIVARDIWLRSRLPETVLEMVWDLVDNDRVGRLQKEEFVVGMWLIDQRLKGRKLPVKVSETVWASVKGLQGIKIRR